MAVMKGKDARISWETSAIAGMGNFSLSQPGPDLLDKTAFGDDWKQVTPGVRDGGTVSFSGNFDWTSTGQQTLHTYQQNGTAITTGSSFRLYMSTGSSGAGYFKLSTGAEMYVTSLNVGQDKGGLGSIDVSLKISNGYMDYTT